MRAGATCKRLLPFLLLLLALVAADDVQDELRRAQKLKLQEKEQLLLQMQHEIQVQLQSLYGEQQRLGSEQTSEAGGYEYPSYCANCLGDTFEPAAKNLLSSEFSRTADGSLKQPHSESELNQLSDHRRLEAIKQQILLKLNLREKPNITSSIPKQLILDTLNRAEERDFGYMQMQMMQAGGGSSDDPIVEKLQSLKMKANESDDEEGDFDDFYGKTREIIIFAEKGECVPL
jgi:hypothetical protein